MAGFLCALCVVFVGPSSASLRSSGWWLSEDPSVWPNKACFRRSDPWLVANHDRLRKLRPRVLVLNFANDVDIDGIRQRTEKYIAARAEASRYHGFKDPAAPAFVEYQVVKYVDLRDASPPPERAHKNSSLFPWKPPGPRDFGCDYHAFYGPQFARLYGLTDPADPARFLNLHQLIDAGLVHELWFYAIHNAGDPWPGFEAAEIKQYYDRNGQPIPGRHGPAGNGDDARTLPWSGRSFTVYFFNPHRGTGCQIENTGHLLEAYANHDAIPPYTRYFREFAEMDLDRRYGLPIASFYALPYGRPNVVSYPSEHSVKFTYRDREYTIDPYTAFAGNVHFAPGARHHYDLSSPFTVRTVMENYRLRNAPGGKDKATLFNIKATDRYRTVAPDGQGQWVIYWCQCMPGLNNKAIDDDGKPMKNWWVYLAY